MKRSIWQEIILFYQFSLNHKEMSMVIKVLQKELENESNL